jgi:hypothetical protein
VSQINKSWGDRVAPKHRISNGFPLTNLRSHLAEDGMKIKMPIVVSVCGIGIAIMGYIMPVYIEIIKPYADYILYFAICLVLGPWLLLLYSFLKNKIHTSTKLTATIITNNPDLFKDLNETALKKHISFFVGRCPYKDTIDNIQLHKSVNKKYQIIVTGKDTSKFEKMKQYWNTNIAQLLNEDFKEVYKSNPVDNLEDDWGILVVDPSTNIPNDFRSKEKWILH